MVKVNPDECGEYYLDGYVKDNLDMVKSKIKDDWDMCFVCSGVEGAGKSTMVLQCARYCSGKRFTSKHVCFNPEDFEEKITRKGFLQKGDSLVLDEGFFINARASMTALNRRFLSILAECRQKNLFLFIICPNFFDLDKNISLWRSRGLFYIYHDKMNRGYFRFYGYEKKKKLYIQGKRFYDYSKIKPDFIGRFTKYMPIDSEEYKKKKLEAFEKRDRNPISEKYLLQRNILFKVLRDNGETYDKIAGYLNERGIKIGGEAVFEAIKNSNLNSQPIILKT